jgi:hypothetical protein
MIKNWKLFLESQEDGGVFQNAEEMKQVLKNLVKPLIVGEILLRIADDKSEIAKAVEMLLNLFRSTFRLAIEEKQEFTDEQREFFIETFNDAVEESRAVFINKNFISGIDNMVDNFIGSLERMKQEMESEGEEWKQEQEEEEQLDYSKMSNRELNNLIDQVLDKRDFETVKMLSKYLKESMNVDSQEILDELVIDIVEVFIEYCYKYI